MGRASVMTDTRTNPPNEPPGLLVSVRNAEEASVALGAGADVIDVKEPSASTPSLVSATSGKRSSECPLRFRKSHLAKPGGLAGEMGGTTWHLMAQVPPFSVP